MYLLDFTYSLTAITNEFSILFRKLKFNYTEIIWLWQMDLKFNNHAKVLFILMINTNKIIFRSRICNIYISYEHIHT
jgi:hypothetical protein